MNTMSEFMALALVCASAMALFGVPVLWISTTILTASDYRQKQIGFAISLLPVLYQSLVLAAAGEFAAILIWLLAFFGFVQLNDYFYPESRVFLSPEPHPTRPAGNAVGLTVREPNTRL